MTKQIVDWKVTLPSGQITYFSGTFAAAQQVFGKKAKIEAAPKR